MRYKCSFAESGNIRWLSSWLSTRSSFGAVNNIYYTFGTSLQILYSSSQQLSGLLLHFSPYYTLESPFPYPITKRSHSQKSTMKLSVLLLLLPVCLATPIPADTKLRASSVSMSSTRAEHNNQKVQARFQQGAAKDAAAGRIGFS